MNISENIRVALRALAANKLRSALTMLGIVIGVGAVVALLAIGNGAAASITSSVEGIGSNMITVMPGRVRMGPGQNTGQRADLYYEDYEALLSGIEGVSAVAPVYQAMGTVKAGSTTAQVTVAATTPAFSPVRAYPVAQGRFLTENDRTTTARVAVLGSQTAKDLFNGLNPLGRKIKIDGVNFEVVGVLASKGSAGLGNADDIVLIPLETGYEKLFGARATQDGKQTLSAISLSATSADVVGDVSSQMDRLLRRQHKLAFNDEPDFTVMSQNDILGSVSLITNTLTIFLGAIAAISLLVGGIGIMNIMLVSVTERTREIGLRKAVGAKRRTILAQFLVETVTLSLLGGLIGISLGVGVALLFTALDWIVAEITLSSVLLSFGFALAVGLFFGIYPAFRAAGLRPMEALRYE
ncbi:MAG: ABC transporter permease [Chloroflexota bacterium]